MHRTEYKASERGLKAYCYEPESEWAKPWREQADDAWNRRAI